METAIEEKVDTPTEGDGATEPQPEDTPALHQSPPAMFSYSDFVHVGVGADLCEDKENGQCGNPLHFHAWVRLPNVIQKNSIRKRAEAAKARCMRQLRDPETDIYAVLQNEMEQTRESIGRSEANRDILIDSILMTSLPRDQRRVMMEMQEEDDWKNLVEDKQRLDHLLSLPEEERSEDEVSELQRHFQTYTETVAERTREAQQPEREALEGRTDEDLVEISRDLRVAEMAEAVFNEEWTAWQMLALTLKPRPEAQGVPVERIFKDMAQLQGAAPEVVEGLERKFNRLEDALSAGQPLGNF